MSKEFDYGRRHYRLQQFVGRVVGQNSSSHTSISGGGTYWQNGVTHQSPISVNTVNKKEFFLISENNRERSFKFPDYDMPPLREGHLIQVISAFKNNNDTGKFVSVRNITLGRQVYIEDNILSLYQSNTIGLLSILIVLGVFASFVGGIGGIIIMHDTPMGILGFLPVVITIFCYITIRNMTNKYYKNFKKEIAEISIVFQQG